MNQLVTLTAEAVRLEVPPEVAAAAAARSARIPGPDGIASAWRGLPVDVQDRIGALALGLAFNAWLWADETQEPSERWLTDAATQAADAQSDRDYEAMMRTIEDSVPALFGSPEQEPSWSTGAELPAPSPIQAAITLHRATWSALQARAAFLTAAAWTDRENVAWPECDAEAEALGDLFLVSYRDRAEARILDDHLARYEAVRRQHPRRPEMPVHAAADIAVRRADLALVLGKPVDGAADVQAAGGLAASIEAHRAAWAGYLAAPSWDGRCAVDDAAEAILLTLCAGQEDAKALVRSAEWYAAELAAVGDELSDGLTYAAKQLTARAGDLSVHVGDSAGRAVHAVAP